jgi:uncharacterized protein (TIGR02118 family)
MPKVRLTVAYNQPPDADAFFAHYSGVHAPLAQAIPGLSGFEWSKVLATPTGETPRYALLAELTFDSMESLGAGIGRCRRLRHQRCRHVHLRDRRLLINGAPR